MGDYVVVRIDPVGGKYNFSVWHPTESEAKQEAIRLSEKYNGAKFVVLKIVGYAERQPIPVTYKENR